MKVLASSIVVFACIAVVSSSTSAVEEIGNVGGETVAISVEPMDFTTATSFCQSVGYNMLNPEDNGLASEICTQVFAVKDDVSEPVTAWAYIGEDRCFECNAASGFNQVDCSADDPPQKIICYGQVN